MLDIITIGAATRDAFIKSDDFKIMDSKEFITGKAECLPLGAKIEVKNINFTTGGGATNTAVTFARQGLSAACLCKAGYDVSGQEVKKNLEDEGVSADLFVISPDLATAYSIILLTSAGDRTILVFRGASGDFEAEDIKEDKINSKWLYVSSLGGKIEILERILQIAESKNIKVAVNPGGKEIKEHSDKLKELLKKTNILLLNREEAAYLTGVDYKKDREIFSNLRGLTKDLVVMTEGPAGVMVCDGKEIYKGGIYPEKQVADRTGAGDAFGSGFVAGIIKTGKIEYAIKLASANATSVVENIGAKTGILSRKDFEEGERWENLEIERIKLS